MEVEERNLPCALYDQWIRAVSLGVKVDNVVAAFECGNRMTCIETGRVSIYS